METARQVRPMRAIGIAQHVVRHAIDRSSAAGARLQPASASSGFVPRRPERFELHRLDQRIGDHVDRPAYRRNRQCCRHRQLYDLHGRRHDGHYVVHQRQWRCRKQPAYDHDRRHRAHRQPDHKRQWQRNPCAIEQSDRLSSRTPERARDHGGHHNFGRLVERHLRRRDDTNSSATAAAGPMPAAVGHCRTSAECLVDRDAHQCV